jgi:hypothetical protein
MLAQRITDPVEAFRQRERANAGSPVYRKKLRTRGLSIHARFVEKAMDVFGGSSIVENVPAAEGLDSLYHLAGKERE